MCTHTKLEENKSSRLTSFSLWMDTPGSSPSAVLRRQVRRENIAAQAYQELWARVGWGSVGRVLVKCVRSPAFVPSTTSEQGQLDLLQLSNAGSRSLLLGVVEAHGFFAPDLGDRRMEHFRRHPSSVLELLGWLRSAGGVGEVLEADRTPDHEESFCLAQSRTI